MLTAGLKLVGLHFEAAQVVATVVAMVFNFQLNNEITYRDQRLRGPRLWRGLLLFMLVCGVGAVANIGIAKTLYESHTNWTHRRRDRRGDRRGVELRGLGDAGLARAVTVVCRARPLAGRARRADPAAPGSRRRGAAGRRTRPITGSGRARWRPAIRTIRRWWRCGSASGTMLAGDAPLGVRLLGPLSVAVASLLLADAADRLLPGRRAGCAPPRC